MTYIFYSYLLFPGQSTSVVNDRTPIIYDGKRHWFTVTVYNYRKNTAGVNGDAIVS